MAKTIKNRALSKAMKKVWARRSKKERKRIGRKIVKNRKPPIFTKNAKRKISSSIRKSWENLTSEQRSVRARRGLPRGHTAKGRESISKSMKENNPMRNAVVKAKVRRMYEKQRTSERKAYLKRRQAIRKLICGSKAWQKEFNRRVSAGARRSYKKGRKPGAWALHYYKGK